MRKKHYVALNVTHNRFCIYLGSPRDAKGIRNKVDFSYLLYYSEVPQEYPIFNLRLKNNINIKSNLFGESKVNQGF